MSQNASGQKLFQLRLERGYVETKILSPSNPKASFTVKQREDHFLPYLPRHIFQCCQQELYFPHFELWVKKPGLKKREREAQVQISAPPCSCGISLKLVSFYGETATSPQRTVTRTQGISYVKRYESQKIFFSFWVSNIYLFGEFLPCRKAWVPVKGWDKDLVDKWNRQSKVREVWHFCWKERWGFSHSVKTVHAMAKVGLQW